MKYSIEVKEAIEYWNKKGQSVEVYLHNTHALELDEFSFNYRAAQSITKGYQGLGIFTHSGEDSYFSKFGRVVYAVLVKKGAGTSREEEDGNMHIETFIPQSQVLEMLPL
jgi:hypothetical protein